jgi:hypothetical protein
MKRSTGEFPSNTLTITKPYKCQKKAIRFHTHSIVRMEGQSGIELTERCKNFLDELEKDGNKIWQI